MATTTGAPVAARKKDVDPAAIQDQANLRVEVSGATKRFHLWQQAPAWILGFAAIGLGFLMVLRGYDSAAGWLSVSTRLRSGSSPGAVTSRTSA
jgi:hypothetical protein